MAEVGRRSLPFPPALVHVPVHVRPPRPRRRCARLLLHDLGPHWRVLEPQHVSPRPGGHVLAGRPLSHYPRQRLLAFGQGVRAHHGLRPPPRLEEALQLRPRWAGRRNLGGPELRKVVDDDECLVRQRSRVELFAKLSFAVVVSSRGDWLVPRLSTAHSTRRSLRADAANPLRAILATQSARLFFQRCMRRLAEEVRRDRVWARFAGDLARRLESRWMRRGARCLA